MGCGSVGGGCWWGKRWLTTTGIAHIVTLWFATPDSSDVSGHLGTRQAIRVFFFFNFPLKSGGRDFSLL